MQSIYRLFAVGFPAGYRMLSVNLIAYFCAASVSDYFAQSFFMVSLLATFSGFAVSSQSYVIGRQLSLPRRMLLVTIFLGLCSAPLYLIWDGTPQSYFITLFATLGYSLFEITRSDCSANGRFKTLVVHGLIAGVLMCGVVLMWRASQSILVVLVFWLLAIPAIPLMKHRVVGGDRLTLDVYKDVASYSLSNGLSTGIMFLIPLIIAGELGEGASTQLAQVVSAAALFLLLPRYLSAGFIVKLQNEQSWDMVRQFERLLITYVVIVASSFFAICYVLVPEFIPYFIFLLAILIGQIGLPYANVHSVFGLGGRMLRVNILTASMFGMATLLVYSLAWFDGSRMNTLFLLYLVYIISRNQLTRGSCMRIFVDRREGELA